MSDVRCFFRKWAILLNQNRGRKGYLVQLKKKRFRAKDFIGVRQKSQRRQAYGTYICILALVCSSPQLTDSWSLAWIYPHRVAPVKKVRPYTQPHCQSTYCALNKRCWGADPKYSRSIFLLFSIWSKNKKYKEWKKKQERKEAKTSVTLKCWFCVKDTDSAQREPPGRSAKMELSVRKDH